MPTGPPGRRDAEWYGIDQYLLYTLSENWSAGLRIECFRDDDGTRVIGLSNRGAVGQVGARDWTEFPGFSANLTELTPGLNWKPKANVTFRPEVRRDWYDAAHDPNSL